MHPQQKRYKMVKLLNKKVKLLNAKLGHEEFIGVLYREFYALF